MKQLPQNFWQWVTGLGLSLVAFALRALGGWDAALGLLLGLMGLDILSGIILSLLHKSSASPGGGFLSRSLYAGLTRKLLMLLLVALAHALDGLLASQVCRVTAIGFYAASEAFSVIENAALAGVPFPQGLLRALERYQNARNQQGLPGEKEKAQE